MNSGMICRRARVGAIILIMAGLVTGLRAEKAATKILHFPDDQFVGALYVEDPCLGTPCLELGRDLSLPLGLDPKRVCLGGDWDYAGLARGDTAVPAGRNIKLMVMLRLRQADSAKIARLPALQYKMFAAERFCVDPDDLSGLSQLRPDDLYMLQVSSLVRTADADQRILEPISHLTGLQILSLCKTGVTDKGMELLKNLRSLQALEFMEERIGVNGLAVLKELPNLEYLDCEPTDAGLKHVGQLQSLRWIRIRTGMMYGPGLAELANCPRLERLCIWGTKPISDRHIKYMEGLTQLKSLTLWGVCDNLTDASMASISKLKNLEELYFIRTGARFTPAGMAHLNSLKNLRKLDFGQIWTISVGTTYGDEVVGQLAALPNLESVKGVSYLTDKGMKSLVTFRDLNCLRVALKDDKQSYLGPTGLSSLAALNSLEELCFTGGKSLSDADIACLESLSGIKELFVGSEHLTDRSLTSISKLSRLESLTISVFGGAGITRNGLQQLSGLTNLQTLDLHPGMNGAADEPPLDFSALTKLNTLTLSGCSLRDADVASLAGLGRLEWLVLDGNFTEEGLWRLRNLSQVKMLDIRGISCTSGEHLDELGGMTKLGDLHLHGRITDAALSRLSGLPSLWSLSVETDEEIRPETIARVREAIASLMFIHVDKPRQMSPPAPRQNQQRAPVNQPRLNRRTQQSRRRY